MSTKRRLLGGFVRVLGDHRSALGVALRREHRVIVSGLGIDPADALLQREAGRVALLTVRAQESARTWAALIEKRRAGRGRRPSPRMIERAARRAALDDATATQALDRLRGLVGEHRPDLARELMVAAQERQHGD
jgi:hypothetical protein